jgi:hypothetical protein
MKDHAMTWALAGQMSVWTILILLAMLSIAALVGRWLRYVSEFYPEPMDEALSAYSEVDDQQDYEEGTEPPRAA